MTECPFCSCTCCGTRMASASACTEKSNFLCFRVALHFPVFFHNGTTSHSLYRLFSQKIFSCVSNTLVLILFLFKYGAIIWFLLPFLHSPLPHCLFLVVSSFRITYLIQSSACFMKRNKSLPLSFAKPGHSCSLEAASEEGQPASS